MTNVIKKVGLGVFIAVATSYILAKTKINQVKNVASNLSFKIDSIKNINFGLGNIKITVDVMLQNNSNIDFSVDAGTLLSLRKVQFFTLKGIKLGEAEKHINNITLFANNATIIEDVEVTIDTTNLGSVIAEIITGLKPSDLVTKAHLEIFGKPYTV